MFHRFQDLHEYKIYKTFPRQQTDSEQTSALYQQLSDLLKRLETIAREQHLHLGSVFEDYLITQLNIDVNKLDLKTAINIVPFGYLGKASKNWNLQIGALFELFAIDIRYTNLMVVRLQSEQCLEAMVDHFKPWIDQMTKDELIHYQLRSANEFASEALWYTEGLATDLVLQLDERYGLYGKLRPKESELLAIASQLTHIEGFYHSCDHISQRIEVLADELSQLIQNGLKCNKAFLLLEALEIYLHYNCKESELASEKIMDHATEIMKPFKVNPHRCAALEETLLLFAGIKEKISYCKIQLFNPMNRISFSYNGLSLENAEYLTAFLRDYDKTVLLFQGEYHAYERAHDKRSVADNTTPMYTISIDAKQFLDLILPNIKETFIAYAIRNPKTFLTAYQEQSKPECAQIASSISKNSATLFAVDNAHTQAIVREHSSVFIKNSP